VDSRYFEGKRIGTSIDRNEKQIDFIHLISLFFQSYYIIYVIMPFNLTVSEGKVRLTDSN